MRKYPLASLDALFERLAKAYPLYLPVANDKGRTEYNLWHEGVEYSTALNTERSAKDFFFPQTENLMDFKVNGKEIEIIDTRSEKEDFIVFGVRACDVRSFDILDRVFLTQPVDSYYANRREHGIIMSMACTRPAETCFCTAFGINPSDAQGDVSCWIDSDFLYMNANTEKGSALLDLLSDITEDCAVDAVNAQKELIAKRMAALPLAALSTEGFGCGKTMQLFEREEWKSLSESCLGCGTCTFVCPTCQCYDIRDIRTKSGVRRYRCWDSCMYSQFTMMSAGQPRISQVERFRQRFMHKLCYFPENNAGIYGCVGCGRCLVKCPISMNIVKVMKTLGGGDR